ncbi:hypothetical protein ACFFX1_37845 [Dactylosporangium sucinum]|uniref:DUF3352 domain-containing protein n=1 Tax=Dactylosporangium sucinum TaxID=1424081 RepID=A0A917WPT1_9ACTN|nr:hypothetical protein [Dactylosporangium sucinum]GGM19883.1 hypothetical protein GCM10007977_021410 [Dactylosporangium sucinum]
MSGEDRPPGAANDEPEAAEDAAAAPVPAPEPTIQLASESAAEPEPEPVAGLEPEPGAPPRRSRRRLVGVLSAAGVALAVVAAGGAFAVARLWQDSVGRMPEEILPASAAAFARINLTPGLSQRLKFGTLFAGSDGNGEHALEKAVFDGAPISYDDVAPWFDGRLGVALWADPAHPDAPVTLVAAAAKDADKARSTLDAAQRKAGTDRLGFQVADGYALLAFGEKDSQGAVSAAAKQPKLAQAADFRSAVGTLPADQPLLGWADLGRATKLAEKLAMGRLTAELGPFGGLGESGSEGDSGGEGESGGSAAGPSAVPDVTGTLVIGAQAAADSIEVRGRLIGGTQVSTAQPAVDAVQALGGMPSGTLASGVVSGPFDGIEGVLGEELGWLPLTLFSSFDVAGGGGPIAVLPGGAIGPGGGDPEAIQKYLEEHPEVLEGGSGSFTFVDPGELKSVEMLDPQKAADAFGAGVTKATALSFSVVSGGDKAGGVPLMVDLRMPDAAAAKQLHTDLAALTQLTSATCEVSGEHVVLKAKSYAPGTGKLADVELFRQAMAGGVAKPSTAVYFDAGDEPVKAIGLTAGRDGADTVLFARLVTR